MEIQHSAEQTVQEVVGRAQQAALHLPEVLVKQGGPRRLEFANVASIYKKGRKEDLENSRPVSLALVPAKVVEAWVPSHSTCRTSRGSTQPAWVLEGRCCLIKVFSFYDKVTCLLGEGKDAAPLDFSEAMALSWRTWMLEAWEGALFSSWMDRPRVVKGGVGQPPGVFPRAQYLHQYF